MDETCAGGTVERLSIYPPIRLSVSVCILLDIWGIWNDAVSSSDFIVLNGSVIHEWWICNDIERSHGQNSGYETEENDVKPQSGWLVNQMRCELLGTFWTQRMLLCMSWGSVQLNVFNDPVIQGWNRGALLRCGSYGVWYCVIRQLPTCVNNLLLQS